jgi:hypothetical protein
MSNPCEGFLYALKHHFSDTAISLVKIYSKFKKELSIGKNKAEFNKVCSHLKKHEPEWGFFIIQIICATSAISYGENLTRIDSEGLMERFVAYIMNFATVHNIQNLSDTRNSLENFRLHVNSLLRAQSTNSGLVSEENSIGTHYTTDTGFSQANVKEEENIPKIKPVSGHPISNFSM